MSLVRGYKRFQSYGLFFEADKIEVQLLFCPINSIMANIQVIMLQKTKQTNRFSSIIFRNKTKNRQNIWWLKKCCVSLLDKIEVELLFCPTKTEDYDIQRIKKRSFKVRQSIQSCCFNGPAAVRQNNFMQNGISRLLLFQFGKSTYH